MSKTCYVLGEPPQYQLSYQYECVCEVTESWSSQPRDREESPLVLLSSPA